MKWISIILSIAFMSFTISCKSQNIIIPTDSLINNKIHDTTFVNLKEYDSDVVLDMKYATEDNFLKSKVYECGSCYLRYKTVKKFTSKVALAPPLFKLVVGEKRREAPSKTRTVPAKLANCWRLPGLKLH